MSTLEQLVRAEFDRWALAEVDEAVFGTADPGLIARTVEQFCAGHLGDPGQALFYRASAGCVVGIRLTSGDEVVLKVMQARWRAPLLGAVQRVQAHLAASGFPCPAPVLGPTALAPGRENLVVVETVLLDPGMRPHVSPAARAVSARGLAQQIALCRALGSQGEGESPLDWSALAAHPLRTPDDRLYPVPHSPLFTFESTARGAEWIDALARRARVRRDADTTAPVVAHTDWSARNVRLDDTRLHAVYDWDSTALVAESTAAGQAAVTWSVTAEPDGSTFPTLEEIEAYLDDYADAVGRPFDAAWRAAARAAAVYCLAYTARCEHALAVRGIARPDQHGARTRLREIGDRLLAERP
jgi:Phosphotransferase enzyme family